jgi:hypothetical protein
MYLVTFQAAQPAYYQYHLRGILLQVLPGPAPYNLHTVTPEKARVHFKTKFVFCQQPILNIFKKAGSAHLKK